MLLPKSGRKGATPKLPPRTPAGRSWSASTKSWWARLWHTPQATQWDERDDVLVRMAWLREKFFANDATGSEMSELRQIEDRLGLTPKALMGLRWRIVPDDQIPAAASETQPRSAAERRGHLKVV